MPSLSNSQPSLWMRVTRWYRQQQAIRDMRNLPDYLLADVGVDREQIPSLVRGVKPHQSLWIDNQVTSAQRQHLA